MTYIAQARLTKKNSWRQKLGHARNI